MFLLEQKYTTWQSAIVIIPGIGFHEVFHVGGMYLYFPQR
jgi:hypothetical protein